MSDPYRKRPDVTSNFSMHRVAWQVGNAQADGTHPRLSDSGGQGRGPQIYMSNKLPGTGDTENRRRHKTTPSIDSKAQTERERLARECHQESNPPFPRIWEMFAPAPLPPTAVHQEWLMSSQPAGASLSQGSCPLLRTQSPPPHVPPLVVKSAIV